MGSAHTLCLPAISVTMLLLLLLLTSILAPSQVVMAYPWHASCSITWTIPTTCQQFRTRIVQQMRAWEGGSNCGTVSSDCPQLPCGQNCLYQYSGTQGNVVAGNHTTPVYRYVDDFTFTTTDNSGTCSVEAYSTSQTWYAFLDYGTNYCNLRNLVDGCGLSDENGFNENTSDDVCTQYSSRNCDRY